MIAFDVLPTVPAEMRFPTSTVMVAVLKVSPSASAKV